MKKLAILAALVLMLVSTATSQGALVGALSSSTGSTWWNSARIIGRAIDVYDVDSVQMMIYFPDSVRLADIKIQKAFDATFTTPIDSATVLDSLTYQTGGIFKVYDSVWGKMKPAGGYVRPIVDCAAWGNHATGADAQDKFKLAFRIFRH
jgi:hypothetical protein